MDEKTREENSMNPELRQQLALQLPPKRLMVFPLVLLVVMTAIYWTAPLVLAFMMLIHWAVDAILFIFAAQKGGTTWIFDKLSADPGVAAVASFSALVFFVVVGIMGSFSAGACQVEATTDRNGVWNKLASATAFAWYRGACCIVAAIVAALIGDAHLLPSILKASAIALIAGALLHATIFRVQLQLVQWGRNPLSRGGILALLVVMLWIGLRVAT